MDTLTRDKVRDAIVRRLSTEPGIVEDLAWDESELYDIASDVCDDLGIDE